MSSRDYWFMLALFGLTVAFRLMLAFHSPYFIDDDSYFWMRQAESISAEGRHFTYDPLSFGGRAIEFSPLFAYLVAGMGLFGGLAVAGKIMLNIFAATTLIFVYLASLHLTGSRHVASLASLISSIIPVWISNTVSSLSPSMVVLPLMSLLVYAYLRLESRPWTLAYLATLTVLSFLHPVSTVFVIGLCLHLLIARLENLPLRKEEIEIILFSILFVAWSAMVQHKKAILAHGASFIWQNIPGPILDSYFTNVDILTTIASIGLVPFAVSVFVTYRYLLRKQSLFATLLISQALAVGVLLYLGILAPRVGYPLFGLFVCLLFSIGYQSFLSWLSQSRFGVTHTFAPILIFMLVVATSLLPSLTITQSAQDQSGIGDHYRALEWLSRHSQENATVLADINEGQLIEAVAKRKTMIDSNFLLAKDASKRYSDLQTLFSTPVISTALSEISAYHIQYIYASPRFLSRFSPSAQWISNPECLSLLYNSTIRIYQVTCSLETL